ncbi:MAG: hypothetical protein QOD53_1016 [Thermoleophilaceae bacterium]|jgi:hypothetical protein|nr:hypothetical protein [Thermoleophilaceae bacterium]
MAELRTQARFPEVADARGHYESFYLRACHPSEPVGVWIRYTVLKRPGAKPRGSLWFTLFDASAAEGPAARKVTLEPGEVGVESGSYIHIGDARFDPHAVAGSALDASWNLTYDSPEPSQRHLPSEWMYRAPIPKTKLLSPHPAARFSGEVKVGERSVQLDGWRGMVGHNWGAQHAERWIWAHGIDFEGADDAWLDIALGRIRLGPLTTPWIGNGALSLDGERHSLGGPAAARGTEVSDRPDGCDFLLPGKGIAVRGRVTAAPGQIVAWVYSDPDGGEHNTLNCSISRMELTVERSGGEPRRLVSAHGAAYEIGVRETDHGVALQPYPDP